jgi:hypothetical protein
LRRLVYDFSMSFPLKLNASADLVVDIHLHEFFLGDRQRECWTYLTTGLTRYGQKEMSLSLLLEDDDDGEKYPKTPIRIFQLLENHARDGKIVDVADATKLGKTGLFGFTALYYLPAIHYEGLPVCDNHLALMLVHQAEYQFARQYGFTRLLSRIGKFCSSFPYPTWNTRRRPSLFRADHREDSMLNDVDLVLLKGLKAELVGDVVLLVIQTSHKRRLEQYLDQLHTENKAFTLQTSLPLTANACLYWEPEQADPGAYTAPDEVTRIGAAFVMFERANSSSGRIAEDGFLFSLSSQSLNRLMASCGSDEVSGIVDSSGLKLSFDWRSNSDDPHPAIPYQPRAGWTDLSDGVTEKSPDKIRLESVTHNSRNTSDRLDSDHLQHYVEAIRLFLLSSMLDESEALRLMIGVNISDGTANFTVNANMDLNPDFIEFMVAGLGQIQPCPAPVPVSFDLIFTVNS